MSKLALQPNRPVKDAFIEELINDSQNTKKAAEVAEDFMKIMMECYDKDARLKLMKMFIGLGENKAYTQLVT